MEKRIIRLETELQFIRRTLKSANTMEIEQRLKNLEIRLSKIETRTDEERPVIDAVPKPYIKGLLDCGNVRFAYGKRTLGVSTNYKRRCKMCGSPIIYIVGNNKKPYPVNVYKENETDFRVLIDVNDYHNCDGALKSFESSQTVNQHTLPAAPAEPGLAQGHIGNVG